jgi:hypothetical protein
MVAAAHPVMKSMSHDIRVYRELALARRARADLISSGCDARHVQLLDARAAALTRYLDGPPLPETIAGFIVCSLLATTLGVIPAIGSLFDRAGPALYALILVGGVAGALASWFIASRNPPMIVDRELSDGDYVVIAHRVDAGRHAA